MTFTQKTLLFLGLAGFIFTLFCIPVTMTLAGHAFPGFRGFWEVGIYDTIRWNDILIWWGAIAATTVVFVVVNKK